MLHLINTCLRNCSSAGVLDKCNSFVIIVVAAPSDAATALLAPNLAASSAVLDFVAAAAAAVVCRCDEDDVDVVSAIVTATATVPDEHVADSVGSPLRSLL